MLFDIKACQKRNINKQLSENIPTDGSMTDAIQKDELETEIRALTTKKAPGPDGVTNDMILYLEPSAKKAILALFNKSWKSGIFLALWKKGHKKGKGNRFLHDRSARVKVDGHLSDERRCTTGGCSSSISTTSPLLSQDMSPTPSMQTTSLSGAQLNKLHQQHTNTRMRKQSAQMETRLGTPD